MLSQLYIKNIAVISEASIDFGPRFNVFTGETGAGKTILVSAINGVLGARMSRDIIRSGEDSAYVSALFTQLPQDVCAKIEEMGFAYHTKFSPVSRTRVRSNSGEKAILLQTHLCVPFHQAAAVQPSRENHPASPLRIPIEATNARILRFP